jgi:elongation factor Tu
VTGQIQLPDGVPFVIPGDHSQADVELLTPMAMEPGTRFQILDGQHLVGEGVVAEVPLTPANGGRP